MELCIKAKKDLEHYIGKIDKM